MAPTVATPVAELAQLPPAVVSDNVVVEPVHNVDAPLNAPTAGTVSTVIVVLAAALQPALLVPVTV